VRDVHSTMGVDADGDAGRLGVRDGGDGRLLCVVEAPPSGGGQHCDGSASTGFYEVTRAWPAVRDGVVAA
jgi:hypothetical protein